MMEDIMKEMTKELKLPILKYNELEDIIIQIIEHKSNAVLQQVK
jgi:hypothetical protein